MIDIKFSLIVPVYNVKKYLKKCLNSVLNQTYQNFEIIVVDDGSNDGSEKICDEFVNKDDRIKIFHKKNGGLSDARNYGLKYANGDYLLFVDSDDYIDKDLLMKIYECININKTDLIKFGCYTVNENYEIINKHCDHRIINVNIDSAIIELTNSDYVETACLYSYNMKFYKENNFEFIHGKLHEDIGLIPFIISKANKINIIDYPGYFYLQRNGSITKVDDYSKIKKGVSDTYDQYLINIKRFQNVKESLTRKALLTYLTECLIIKIGKLNNYDKKIYYNKLKEIKFIKNMYGYNWKKVIKKIIAFIDINLYIKIFR